MTRKGVKQEAKATLDVDIHGWLLDILLRIVEPN